LLLDLGLKGILLLVVAWGLVLTMSRQPAAARHLVWSLAMCGLVVLPFLHWVTPTWRVPILPAAPKAQTLPRSAVGWSPQPVPQRTDAVRGTESAPTVLPNASPMPVALAAAASAPEAELPAIAGRATSAATSNYHPARKGLVMAWALIAGVLLLPRAIGLVLIRGLLRSGQTTATPDWTALVESVSRELGIRRRVRICQSACVGIPMTSGWLRPMLLLPQAADDWPEARRRNVLLHELAHVKRWDNLSRAAAQWACALYWPNPLVWLAARRMHQECERACDDVVLNTGIKPSDYAGELLQIAAHAGFRRYVGCAAIGMASKPAIEGRLREILDPRRNRRTLSRRLIWIGAVLTISSALPIADLRLEGKADGVEDNSGQVVNSAKTQIAESEVKFCPPLSLSPPLNPAQWQPGYKLAVYQFNGDLFAPASERAPIVNPKNAGSVALDSLLSTLLASGRVVDAHGDPVRDASVILCTPDRPAMIQNGRLVGDAQNNPLKSDPARCFANTARFQGGTELFIVAPKTTNVVLVHDCGFAWFPAAELDSHSSIALVPWGRIEGRLLLGSQPGSGRIVRLYPSERRNFYYQCVNYSDSAVTNPDGSFVLDRVPPGWAELGYEVGINSRQVTLTDRTAIKIEGGKTTRVRLGGGGRTVSGKFIPGNALQNGVDYDGGDLRILGRVFPDLGQPLAYSDACLQDPDYRCFAFPLAADGSFRIDDVAPGRYWLAVRLAAPPQNGGPAELIGPFPFTWVVDVPKPSGDNDQTPVELGLLKLDLVRQISPPITK
jgi:beta-lactamase regulating signal transducer with metallopeptidase domain